LEGLSVGGGDGMWITSFAKSFPTVRSVATFEALLQEVQGKRKKSERILLECQIQLPLHSQNE
jgi:hypothetical protein